MAVVVGRLSLFVNGIILVPILFIVCQFAKVLKFIRLVVDYFYVFKFDVSQANDVINFREHIFSLQSPFATYKVGKIAVV
jgi:hypothetical protein